MATARHQLLWDEEARNTVCAAGEVWSLRQFLQAAAPNGNGWPDDLPSNDNRTLVVAGLEGKRLLDAPRWDLVVFDEAHHLTAYRTGGKVRKTENYKLAEALKDHSRDLLLLSATPHQGNHFQFWMLAQLLNPTLFGSPEEMLENRHRLNTVMFRRTTRLTPASRMARRCLRGAGCTPNLS